MASDTHEMNMAFHGRFDGTTTPLESYLPISEQLHRKVEREFRT